MQGFSFDRGDMGRDHRILVKESKDKNWRAVNISRANFGSARAHARSTAAKVLVDGANPFTFLFAL